MATYDPLDFHGGGYGSSWQFEYDDYGYDRGYGRSNSHSSRCSHGAGAYGEDDDYARSYDSYDRDEPRRSSYGGGYGDRGGYGRSDYYGDGGRSSGYEASSSSYGGAYAESRGRDYAESRGRDYADRGYGTRSREYAGSSSNHSRSGGYGGGRDGRSYGGYERRVELMDRGDRRRDGGNRTARRDGGGRHDSRRSDQRREGGGRTGAGLISGSGYETIGGEITDPRLNAEWSGTAGLRDLKSDDPDVLKSVGLCARPPVPSRNGRTVLLKVNYFGVEIVSGPNQVFKYHVTVERTSDREEDEKYGPRPGDQAGSTGAESAEPNTDAQPNPERRPERSLQRSLVTSVVNAVLRQNEAEFGGIRVVHDGMAALYSPAMLPWNSKEFKDVSLYPPQSQPRGNAGRDGPNCSGWRGPRTFVIKVSLVETICMQKLLDHYSDQGVNVMPVLQALDVVARHLACQRLTLVGRDLYTLKETHALHGGKELCWGYHQAIRKAEDKLVMNVNEASAVFYTPGPLMNLTLRALRVKDPRQIRDLSR